MTRHPKPSIVSFVKVMTFDDYDDSFYNRNEGPNFWFSHLPLPYDSEYFRSVYDKYYAVRWEATPAQSASLAFAASLASYLKLKEVNKMVDLNPQFSSENYRHEISSCMRHVLRK